ncbi:MAG: hypothetical protein WC375_00310 [Methanomassiliicoccales archaeon]|jgi:hypothetical protein
MPRGKSKKSAVASSTESIETKETKDIATISCIKCHQPKQLRARLSSVFKASGLSLDEFKKSYVCGACKLAASNASKAGSATPSQEIVCRKCHQPKKFMGRMKAQFEKSGLTFDTYKEQYVCGPCNAGVKPKVDKDLDAISEEDDLSMMPAKQYAPIIYSPRGPQSVELNGSTSCWHQPIFLKNRTCDECRLYDRCGYHAKALSKAEQLKRSQQFPTVQDPSIGDAETSEVEVPEVK